MSPKTIGYIHGIVTDCITRLPSDACTQRALRNEIMILEVLESQEPAVFRQELFNTFTTYYEEIQSMSGAGGRPQPKHFKRRMIAAGGAAGCGALAAGGDDDEPPPPAADDAAPADPATTPAKKGGKGRADPGGAKAQ